MEDNIKLWREVEKTDPKHTKKANVRGNKITAIAPQYQIMNATIQFGRYGDTWGFKELKRDYSLLDTFNLVVLDAVFYYPSGEFPISSSIKMYMNKENTMIDSDFAKKLETDTLTKALSKLGFNADVFMGRYDDVKYLEQVTKEFETPPEEPTKQSVEYIIEQATDIETLTAWKGWISKFDLTDIATEKASKLK